MNSIWGRKRISRQEATSCYLCIGRKGMFKMKLLRISLLPLKAFLMQTLFLSVRRHRSPHDGSARKAMMNQPELSRVLLIQFWGNIRL